MLGARLPLLAPNPTAIEPPKETFLRSAEIREKINSTGLAGDCRIVPGAPRKDELLLNPWDFGVKTLDFSHVAFGGR